MTAVNGASAQLSGVDVTVAAGTLGVVTSSTVALTGQSMTASAGTLGTSDDEDGPPQPTYASSMLLQFDDNMLLVLRNPTGRRFKPSRYRFTLDKEADSAVDGTYYLGINDAGPVQRWFGRGENVWRATVVVQLGFHRGGGDKGGHRGEDRRSVLGAAANDCMKVADVCSNPENYDSENSGIRRVTFVRLERAFDLAHSEIWQVIFDVEWQSLVITE